MSALNNNEWCDGNVYFFLPAECSNNRLSRVLKKEMEQARLERDEAKAALKASEAQRADLQKTIAKMRELHKQQLEQLTRKRKREAQQATT